jgi:hypothetical protein
MMLLDLICFDCIMEQVNKGVTYTAESEPVMTPFEEVNNVLGLAEVGAFEAQMFNLAQMLIRIPMLKFSNSAPILANPC